MVDHNRKLKVLIAALSAVGHINLCLTIGQHLKKNGHEVIFAIDHSWSGKFEKMGFKEEIYFEKKSDYEKYLKEQESADDSQEKKDEMNSKIFEFFLYGKMYKIYGKYGK